MMGALSSGGAAPSWKHKNKHTHATYMIMTQYNTLPKLYTSKKAYRTDVHLNEKHEFTRRRCYAFTVYFVVVSLYRARSEKKMAVV